MKVSPVSTLLSTLILGLSLLKTPSVEAIDCGTFESKMIIAVETDIFDYELSWILERDDGMGGWIEEEQNNLNQPDTVIVERVCLEPSSTYRWTIFDTYGDGIFADDPIQVAVNGDVIFTEPCNLWTSLEVTFITPGNPDNGSVIVLTDSPTLSPTMNPTESMMPSVTASNAPSDSPTASLAPSDSPTASSVPSDSPTVFTCAGDDSKLVIFVTTDFGCFNNEWVLEEFVMGGYVEVGSNPLDRCNSEYEDRFCLTPDTQYRWTITDLFGNGIFYVNDPFSLVLNGEEFYEQPSKYWFSLEIVFVTPSDPSGPVQLVTKSPSSSPSSSPSDSVMPSSTPTDSLMPSSSPSAFVCDNEDDDVLKISVTTDSSPFENVWFLELKNENSGNYEQIEYKSFFSSFTLHVDYVCLIPGRSYRWTMVDDRYNRRGDGLNCDPGACGYSVDLNGEEIVSNGKFFDEVVKEIGPVECVEESGFHRVVNPKPGRNKFKRVYCSGVRKIIRQTGDNSVCALPLLDGSGNLWDKCKASCGFVGLGPCAD